MPINFPAALNIFCCYYLIENQNEGSGLRSVFKQALCALQGSLGLILPQQAAANKGIRAL